MPKFQKGHTKTGGRVRGTKNRSPAAGIAAWAREMFEDPRYQLSVRTRLFKGRLPPQVECKLLAYAYGEPARDITLNANLRGLVSVVHEHVSAAVREAIDAETVEADGGSPHCITMHESVVGPMNIHPAKRLAEGESA